MAKTLPWATSTGDKVPSISLHALTLPAEIPPSVIAEASAVVKVMGL